MIQNKEIVIVKIAKDSSMAITKKVNYVAKLETMIHSGIIKDTSIDTSDILKLLRLQEFLYRKFYNCECY